MLYGLGAKASGVPELQLEPPGIQAGPPGTWTVTHFIYKHPIGILFLQKYQRHNFNYSICKTTFSCIFVASWGVLMVDGISKSNNIDCFWIALSPEARAYENLNIAIIERHELHQEIVHIPNQVYLEYKLLPQLINRQLRAWLLQEQLVCLRNLERDMKLLFILWPLRISIGGWIWNGAQNGSRMN